ncbi:MAG TPA: helix-turn-helix domain-containing protein [Dehalococcoidia bacterium]|nr:helix-turn-helix domain-containing protein [Dehalococcoidia bacterium]
MAGLGAILQQTREARGVSLEEAERVTHIARRYLQGLEDEDFSVFPAPVFARGFLRNYSQYLGLDPDEMAALWPGNGEQPLPRPELAPETGRSEFERRTRPLRERTSYERTGVRRVYGSRSGRAPGPLSRGVAGRTRQGSATPALVAVAVGMLALLLVAFVASRAGGSPSGVVANTGGGLPAGGSQPAAIPTAPPRSAGRMPELVGKSEETALAQLQQAGVTPLVIGVTSTNRAEPPGTVLRQDPAAGTAITTNSSVSLIVNGPVAAAPSPTPQAGATPRSTATPRATATPRGTR